MDELKVYTNKNIGSFLSIPASKIAKTNNLEDSIYLSRHLNKLRNKSIDQLRDTEHYKSKTQQYAESLKGIDTTSLKDMSTKLKLNMKMYNPLAKTTDSKYKEGGSARKSYKTIELLQVSKNSFKPMLFLGGNPNAAARSFIGFQQPRMARGRVAVKPFRQQTPTQMRDTSVADINITDSLMKDSQKLLEFLKGGLDMSNIPLDILRNPLYEELYSNWDPRTVVFEEDMGINKKGGKQQGGVLYEQVIYGAITKEIFDNIKKIRLEHIKKMVQKVREGSQPVRNAVIRGTNVIFKLFELKDEFMTKLGYPPLGTQKKLYMVLANITDENEINRKSVNELSKSPPTYKTTSWPVGFFVRDKKNISLTESTISLQVQESLYFKWYSMIVGGIWSGKKDWILAIGNHMRKDYKLTLEEIESLKKGDENVIKRLENRLKTPGDKLQGDVRIKVSLNNIRNRKMTEEDWIQLQNYSSIPVKSTDAANRIKISNNVLLLLFLLWGLMVILLILQLCKPTYTDSVSEDIIESHVSVVYDIENENVGRPFKALELLHKALLYTPFKQVVETVNHKLSSHGVDGDTIREIVNVGLIQPYQENELLYKDEITKHIFQYIGTLVSNFFRLSKSDSTTLNDILPASPEFLKVIHIDEDFQESQRYIIHGQLRRLHKMSKNLQNPSTLSGFFNFIKTDPSADEVREIYIKYIGMQVRKQITLEKKHRDIIDNDTNLPKAWESLLELTKDPNIRRLEGTLKLLENLSDPRSSDIPRLPST